MITHGWRSIRYMTVPLASLVMLLAGCGPSHQELMARDKLEKARATFEAAKADQNVQTYAPVTLFEAGRKLTAAEKTEDYAEMEHLAYLADRKTNTAIAIAEQKVAENQLEQLSKESAATILMKREREVAAARSTAEERAIEIERLQKEAEQKARELEKAKQEVGMMTGESEQARKQAEARAREVEKLQKETEQKALELEKAKQEAEAKAREIEKAKQEAEQASRELEEVKGKQTERGIVMTLGDVIFETGKAKLSERAKQNITKIANFMKKYPDRGILVEGHTDSVGTAAYNLVLSQRRADAVKKELMTMGVEAKRIIARGYGEQYPVDTNETNLGRQNNRRVEIVILKEGVKPETVTR